MSQSGQSTPKSGTRDSTYDLVSILYHSLEGATLYDQYIHDAEKEGFSDLVQFFRDVRKEEQVRADRCKQLLAQHLTRSSSGQRKAA